MKRILEKILGMGAILILTGITVSIGYSIITNEIRNGKVLKNPVTIEGKVVSSKLKGRDLEVKIDSSVMPVYFSAYTFSLGFSEGRYKHDIGAIQSLNEKLKKGDQVKIEGFKDSQTNMIYGSDIKRSEYVSLINTEK